jgi:hypothetical protein
VFGCERLRGCVLVIAVEDNFVDVVGVQGQWRWGRDLDIGGGGGGGGWGAVLCIESALAGKRGRSGISIPGSNGEDEVLIVGL